MRGLMTKLIADMKSHAAGEAVSEIESDKDDSAAKAAPRRDPYGPLYPP